MNYDEADLDMLESFFLSFDFGDGIQMSFNAATILVDRAFVDERIRLMRYNLIGAKNEKYGLNWFELLLEIKRRFSDDRTTTQGMV